MATRKVLKRIAEFVSRLLVLPFVLLATVEASLRKNDRLFAAMAKGLSLIPGTTGSYLRRMYYKGTLSRCGEGLTMDFGSFFSHRNGSLGDGVSIGAYSIIGTVDIGNNVLIASRVSIPSGRYQHMPENGKKLQREVTFTRLVIGDNVWIGEGAVVLASVGSDCIVGAGSVVVNEVGTGLTVAGNPARDIKAGEGSDGNAV